MASIDRRIDQIERDLHARTRKKPPESTPEDLLKRFAWNRFIDGLKDLMDFLPEREQAPVHTFWSWLHNPRAMRSLGHAEPEAVPLEIENKIFEIAWNCGYAYLRSAAVLFDDPVMLARATDLRSWDVPDLSRIPHYGYILPGMTNPDLEASDWHIRLRNKGKPWREFLKWYQDHGFGTFGPASDFDQDHALHGMMGYEENYRYNVASWLDVYGQEVVNSIIDLEKINSLDQHITRRDEENKNRRLKHDKPT